MLKKCRKQSNLHYSDKNCDLKKGHKFARKSNCFLFIFAYLFSSNLDVDAWVLKGVVFSFEGSLEDVRFTSEVCWDTLPLLFILLSKTNGEFLGWNGGRGSPKKWWKFRFIFSTGSTLWLLLLDWSLVASLSLLLSLLVLLSTHPTGWWFTLISLIAEKTNPKALGNHENHWLHIPNT